ncbi:MAG: pilus assembly protein PilO [Deltaproteobacteria bacterium]|nr:pilus assembly protein PilO [Deltaproteobacteria bacterium]TLN05137.1 MAG: pilus assembly protein PilO [bacterium]
MDLGIDKIAKLPNKQKIALLILLLLAEVAALFFLLIQPKYKELKGLGEQLASLQQQVQQNRILAARLPILQKEYDQLTRQLDAALTELPNQKEIPKLLTSVTDEGKKAGLDFLVFRPQAEQPKDFYAAVPVDITVSGKFSSVGNFFAAVGNLPRIMNISNVNFSDIKSSGNETTLKVTCLATTFRFLEKEEQKNETK